MANEDCIFCKIARGEIPTKIILESENFIAFPDKNPKTDGHTLIVSKKHFVNMIDLPADLASEIVGMVKNIFEIRQKQGAEGFNLVMNNFPAAGQVVMHAHLHFLPRKKGDRGFHNV